VAWSDSTKCANMNDKSSKPEAYDDFRAVGDNLAGGHRVTTCRQAPYHSMNLVGEQIRGYTYGTSEAATSRVSTPELVDLKISLGFTDEDQPYANENSVEDVQKRRQAPCNWTQLQLPLWAESCTEAKHGLNEW
jgi:hypothetical protein